MSPTRPYERSAARWSDEQVMSDFEAALWRSAPDPDLLPAGVFLDVLDAVPDFDRLRAAHEWAVRRIPRLGQRVVDDPLRLGPPVWTRAPVDMDRHLHRTRLETGGGIREVLEIAGDFHAAPLDPARPLWEAMLVEGLDDGRAAYLLKLHDALGGGPAFVEMFDLLHSDRREPTPSKPVAETGPPSLVSPLGLAAGRAAQLARDAPALAARAVRGTAVTSGRLALRPVGSALAGLRWSASMRRVAATPAPPSPLFARRGLTDRQLLAIDVPFSDLREAGRAAGGTLNDAFLTALAAGLRRYHEERGVEPRDVGLTLPVRLMQPDETSGARFAMARIALPLEEPDVLHALQIVRWRVLEARHEEALDVMGAVAPVVSRLPRPVLSPIIGRAAATVDVQAGNLRGLDRAAYIAGGRVERMYPFSPAFGCAIVATLVSHEETCCIGVTVDGAAVDDVAGLERCLRDGLADVLALAAPAAAA